jgi:uncharacterized glyoxalase superfamily protein PhnB
MQTTSARLTRIAPELPATNLSETIEYYEQRLGFEVTMRMPGGDYAIVERDSIALHLFEDAARVHSRAGLHIFTPDLDELHAELKARGAHFKQEIAVKPWGNREFRIVDQSGNELKFTEAANLRP